jgi:hypothetical protein
MPQARNLLELRSCKAAVGGNIGSANRYHSDKLTKTRLGHCSGPEWRGDFTRRQSAGNFLHHFLPGAFGRGRVAGHRLSQAAALLSRHGKTLTPRASCKNRSNLNNVFLLRFGFYADPGLCGTSKLQAQSTPLAIQLPLVYRIR